MKHEHEHFDCQDSGFSPVPPPIPPVRYVPGMNVQEQLCNMSERVNTAINRWNQIQGECYKALDNVVGAAVNNSVYYSPDEVRFSEGYSEEDACGYAVVEARSVDRAGKPIFCNLRPAYNSVTNSGARELITDTSFVTSGQMVMTAFQATETRWKGSTVFNGNPGNSTPDDTVWVAGWTRNGVLRFFNGDVGEATLKQNRMVNCIGPVFPILKDGKLFSEVLDSMGSQPGSIQAMGWKQFNGNKVFISCSLEDAKGMTPMSVAKVMQNMGVTNAVICSYQTAKVSRYDAMPIGTESPAAEPSTLGLTGSMTFLGKITTAPIGWDIPRNAACWVISKRPQKGWNNEFTSEIASTVQKLGNVENQLNSIVGKLDASDDNYSQLEYQLNDLADKVAVLDGATSQFEDRVSATEDGLKNLQETVDKNASEMGAEIAEVKTDVDGLKQSVETLTETDQNLRDEIGQEVTERKSADAALQAALNSQVSALQSADRVLQNNIEKEAAERQGADASLQALIKAEESARISGDNSVRSEVVVERTERQAADAALQTQIDSNKREVDAQVQTVQNAVKDLQDGVGLPIATTTTLGVVKVGQNLNVSPDGTLNAEAGGGTADIRAGSGILINTSTSGTQTISVDGNVVVDEDELKAAIDPIKSDVEELQSAKADQAAKDQVQDERIESAENQITEATGDLEKVKTDVSDIGDRIDSISDTVSNIQNGSGLPIASADTLGAIKVGANLSVSEDGTLSASAGEGSSGETVAQGDGISVTHDEETNVATVALSASTKSKLAEIDGKASSTSLMQISDAVATLQTTVAGKADKATVSEIDDKLAMVDLTVKENGEKLESVETVANSAASGVSSLNSAQVALNARVDSIVQNQDAQGADVSGLKEDVSKLQEDLKSVDDAAQSAIQTAADAEMKAENKVDKSGDTMTGMLRMNNTGVTFTKPLDDGDTLQATIKASTGGIILSGTKPISGGSGIDIINPIISGVGSPLVGSDAANKVYVDNTVNSVQDVAQQASETASSAVAKADAAQSTANDAKSTATTAQTTANNALPKSGGSMSGAINMVNRKITSLATPTSNGDAANKLYVDSKRLVATELPITVGLVPTTTLAYLSTSSIAGYQLYELLVQTSEFVTGCTFSYDALVAAGSGNPNGLGFYVGSATFYLILNTSNYRLQWRVGVQLSVPGSYKLLAWK